MCMCFSVCPGVCGRVCTCMRACECECVCVCMCLCVSVCVWGEGAHEDKRKNRSDELSLTSENVIVLEK